MKRKLMCALLLGCICLVGCIGNGHAPEESEPTPGPGTNPGDNINPPGGQLFLFPLFCETTGIVSGENSDQTEAACIPPLHPNDFVYLNLSTLTEVFPQDPLNSTEWDIAVKNWVIKVNGGVNGIGGVEVAYQEGADFFATTQAPSIPYYTDFATTDVGFFEGLGDYVFLTYPPAQADESFTTGPIYVGAWKYTLFLSPFHTLSARDAVYFIRAANGTYFKLKPISNYKDLSQGEVTGATVGFFSFYLGAIDAPGN